jgi:hypothetical protein
MSERTLPLLFLNLGGEMLYVLDQRLKAQVGHFLNRLSHVRQFWHSRGYNLGQGLYSETGLHIGAVD